MCLITLIPAYKIKYDNVSAVLYDWNAGKDFRILHGALCTKRDLETLKKHLGADRIVFRWISPDNKVKEYMLWENWETKHIPTNFVYGPLNNLI